MVERLTTSNGGVYFEEGNSTLEFFSSGCTILDCVLGGGWALGRVANIVGDRSSGKTLLAIEATANFHKTYPNGKIFYREAEAAFDESYAAKIGMPIKAIDFGYNIDFVTVEDMFHDLSECIKITKKSGEPGFYIVDSLDALSDEGELEREIDKGSYGAEKAKKLSRLFRTYTQDIAHCRMAIMIISQIRDRMNPGFGRQYARSGGRALDFYASHILYLAHIKRLPQTIHGVERVNGVRIKARTEKNKIGPPFRECEFDINFNYGIDDLSASVDFLQDVKHLERIGIPNTGPKGAVNKWIKQIESMEDDDYYANIESTGGVVKQVWQEIEKEFEPKRSKYRSTEQAKSTGQQE